MTVGRLALALATTAAGVLAMGAGPPPAPGSPEAREKVAEAAIAKAVATPRLYKIAVTGSHPPAIDGSEICIGAGPMLKLVTALARDPEAVAAMAKGCTQTHSKTANSVHMEMTCDQAAGAAFTSHMTLDGTVADGVLREIRQRTEMSLEGASGTAQPTPSWTDVHMTLVGDCPAGMKPDQVRSSDGKISDPMADLAALGSAKKDGSAKK